jgi:hypothetical protein
MFAATAQYSTTGSIVGGVFAGTSLTQTPASIRCVTYGKIENDYNDYPCTDSAAKQRGVEV